MLEMKYSADFYYNKMLKWQIRQIVERVILCNGLFFEDFFKFFFYDQYIDKFLGFKSFINTNFDKTNMFFQYSQEFCLKKLDNISSAILADCLR